MAVATLKASVLLTLLLGVLSPAMAAQEPQTALEKVLATGMQAARAGNFVEAEKIDLAAVEEAKQSNDPHLVRALEQLADVYSHVGKRDQAIDCMKQALAVDETTLGPDTLKVAFDLNNLAMQYGLSDDAETEKCFKRALDILDNLPEPQRSRRIIIINNLSQFYMRKQRYAESEALLKPAVEDQENSLHPNGQGLGNLRHLLIMVYEKEGKDSEAATLRNEEEQAVQPGESSHVDPAMIAMRQAENYRRSGKLEAAEADYLEAIARLERARTDNTRRGAYPWFLPHVLDGLGELYVAEKRNSDAEEIFKRAFDLREQYASPIKEGVSLARTMLIAFDLLNLYRSEGRLNEMESFYERALTVQERVLGPQNSATGETLLEFARLYREEGKEQEAAPLYQRALEILRKNEGETPRFAAMLEDYAGLLQALGKKDDAAAVRLHAKAIHAQFPADNQGQ